MAFKVANQVNSLHASCNGQSEVLADNVESGDGLFRHLAVGIQYKGQSFSEILAPVRQSFRESGMTEDQLEALFEDAREKAHREDLTNKE